MRNYFLFIDTETSGLPKNWKLPYAQENNWPYIIQIAWIVYDRNFNEIEKQNHFIENSNFSIEKSSQEIHHITEEYLRLNGKEREKVMLALEDVVKKYDPIIVGHFMEFDYHMINVEFQRIGKSNVITNQPFFCTMKASKPYVRNPRVDLLKLNEFYQELFNEKPKAFHNALSDALNTAKIFFHLFKDQPFTKQIVDDQHNDFSIKDKQVNTQNESGKSFINKLFSI